MYQKILVPVDFGESTSEVLNHALTLAKEFHSEVHMLHVIPDLASLASGPDGFVRMPAESEEELLENARKRLEEITFSDQFLDVKRTEASRGGAPFVEIIRYAREKQINLIVLGTHGRSGVVHMLLGSVAEKVIRKSPCPVLTIRPQNLKVELP